MPGKTLGQLPGHIRTDGKVFRVAIVSVTDDSVFGTAAVLGKRLRIGVGVAATETNGHVFERIYEEFAGHRRAREIIALHRVAIVDIISAQGEITEISHRAGQSRAATIVAVTTCLRIDDHFQIIGTALGKDIDNAGQRIGAVD